jgi:hypothetical protein
LASNQWRTNGANGFAPMLIGALVKINGANECAIMIFPTSRQWRNGALLVR